MSPKGATVISPNTASPEQEDIFEKLVFPGDENQGKQFLSEILIVRPELLQQLHFNLTVCTG